ncbi:microcystin-dependent protein [Caulobacter ginsengisoli]|uniref:Microcystin-dependent protein n=1 Tax=Caulobacter ginsengisoli TaxID=400775 RepID=A0ABU0IXM4_9CAUL|nr:tail fiber protein [Caulobacter ginsengisoli]MDQ0466125.1 microcystin-dependent protein [Caulobacter ginsengisoli]
MGTPFVGEIRMFSGSFAPAGWAFCNGRLLPIGEYQTLFQLIGTIYGGDGVNTFAVPDLQGRAPAGAGAGSNLQPYAIGEKGGVETVTLTAGQIPQHNHPKQATTQGQVNVPTGALLAVPQAGPAGTNIYGSDPPAVSLDPSSVQDAGANEPHENMQAFLTISFIIALFGRWPSQTDDGSEEQTS